MDSGEELVRLQVLLLRREAKSQAELIGELHGVGFSNSRIAALLGTTAGTVHVAIQRMKVSKPKDG